MPALLLLHLLVLLLLLLAGAAPLAAMDTWFTESPEPSLPVCMKDSQKVWECLKKSFDHSEMFAEAPRHPIRVGRLSAGRAGGTVDVHLAIAKFHGVNEDEAELELTAHLGQGSISGPFWVWHDGLWLPIPRNDVPGMSPANGGHLGGGGGAGGGAGAKVFLNVCRRPPRRVAGCMLLCAASWQVSMHLRGEFVWKGGHRHLRVDHAMLRAERGFANISFYPTDGDDIVGQTMTEYLNENAVHVLREVEAHACWALLGVCRQMVERLFERVPFDDLVVKGSALHVD